jgi:hypothetical protein
MKPGTRQRPHPPLRAAHIPNAPGFAGGLLLDSAQYLRRKEAGEYLKTRYGHGSPRTLAKLATLGGGPIFRKFGRIVVYDPADLDTWALARLSAPLRSCNDRAPKRFCLPAGTKSVPAPLRIAAIRIDGATQGRASLREDVVNDYVEAIIPRVMGSDRCGPNVACRWR